MHQNRPTDIEREFTEEVDRQTKIIIDKGETPTVVLVDEYGKFGFGAEENDFINDFNNSKPRRRAIKGFSVDTVGGYLDTKWVRVLPIDLLVLNTSIITIPPISITKV
jgi:hypothetical protein